jgi:hypothetical protein
MADQRHDLIARLTTDSIDMGTYDMAMPADRDTTYTPDPADKWTVTRWMDKQGRIWRRETGGRWAAFDAGRIRLVGVPPKDELADVIAAVGALVPIDVDRIAPVLAELGRLRALAAAGRLLPADAETRTEWGVRMTWDNGTVEDDECDRRLAERRVRWHAERRTAVPGWRVTAAEVVTRVRTTTAGSWLPVPAAKIERVEG